MSGDKKLLAKFDRPAPQVKKAASMKPSPGKARNEPPPPTTVNIENHNEVYIFANSVVLPPEAKSGGYDIVTDQPGLYKTKNLISLDAEMDPLAKEDKEVNDESSQETFRMKPLLLSKPTPKFVTPAGSINGKRRFVFFCEADGVATSQVIQQQSTLPNRIFSKRGSNTPSMTDHLDNPGSASIIKGQALKISHEEGL